jgi:hypothetical protein
MTNNNNNNNNNNNDEPIDLNIGKNIKLPVTSPLKYTPIDIDETYDISMDSVNLFVSMIIIFSLIAVVLLYFKSNGYTLAGLFKGLNKHMYLSGKGGKRLPTVSTKTIIVPNR